MRVAAILAAAGKGTRLGTTIPKQFHDLGDGSMLLSRSLQLLIECAAVDEIVVAMPSEAALSMVGPVAKPLTGVVGGATRQESVTRALARVSDAADLIVIHDAARPFATAALLERTIAAARAHGAAIAAIPVHDTVKQASSPDAAGRRTIAATLPRERIFLAQTPQAFRRDLLTAALTAGASQPYTDEAALVERAGFPVQLVEGESGNVKVTTADDLARARAQVREGRSSAAPRVGTGYDLHRLVEGRPLVLAGVIIPFERGLAGHSDADVICHAVTDAVLGAAALGDIGQLFPDTEAAWKDADSVGLLRRAMEVVNAAGYAVANVDVTVITERPKLLPHVPQMRGNLAAALGIGLGDVSIKGKTSERTGAIGRGEAIVCHAVALLTQTG
jgi:2-C-methyl-D-erythritol 4-phosphate cytidylyltransferase/2-C-methyl-D-erythritol 2,4-cyclodiphosphate synthase